MILITRAEISYFRSIYKETIKDLSHLSVLSGKNDAGKSNFLKALNLFFNNQTDWNTPFNFPTDLSIIRKPKAAAAKGRQFISVKLHFITPKSYRGSLPDTFWVSRQWNMYSSTPTESCSLTEENIRSKSLKSADPNLTKLLNKIRFFYVPAVKHRAFFNYALGELRSSIMDEKSAFGGKTKTVIEELSKAIKIETQELEKEFETASGVNVSIIPPANLEELFRTFSVESSNGIGLNFRGDGLQVRFIPSLLHNITQDSKEIYIWGFEEPENCLEYSLASLLANDFANKYSSNAQILTTSHSPAFLSLSTKENSKRVSVFRVFQGNYIDPQTKEKIPSSRIINTKEHRNQESEFELLNKEIGIIEMYEKHHGALIKDMDALSKAYDLSRKIIDTATGPTLLVEGKTDVKILNEAWNKLFSTKKMPFNIESCDLYLNNPDYSAAGTTVLLSNIESHRESEKPQLALVDYDHAGMDCFKDACNNKNFDKQDDCLVVGKNKKAALMLIPEIKGLERYRELKNLPLEFLFPTECLKKKTSKGFGLNFKKAKEKRMIRDIVISEKEIDLLEARIICDDGGKAVFANDLVPNFPKECFKNFIPLFDKIDKAFKYLQK